MTVLTPPKIVLLGMMSRIPVAGAVWGAVQYLVGFRRLGCDVYYVEAHARKPHVAFFTWGLNYGRPDCRVPLPAGFRFSTSPPAVVPDLWDILPPVTDGGLTATTFTTIGNWRQAGQVTYRGEVYTWSKHHE